MAIYRLLKDTTFEPEALEAMGRAYEDLLADLRLADREDPFTEIIAKEVIRVASSGVKSATEIRARVLTALGARTDFSRPGGGTDLTPAER